MNIFEQLFFGEINPSFENFIDNPNYQKAVDSIGGIEKELSETLAGKEKALFNEYLNIQSEIHGTSAYEQFRNGFILGAKLIVGIINAT